MASLICPFYAGLDDVFPTMHGSDLRNDCPTYETGCYNRKDVWSSCSLCCENSTAPAAFAASGPLFSAPAGRNPTNCSSCWIPSAAASSGCGFLDAQALQATIGWSSQKRFARHPGCQQLVQSTQRYLPDSGNLWFIRPIRCLHPDPKSAADVKIRWRVG